MQVLGGLALIGSVGLCALVLLHGLANTLDTLAWRIHRAARSLREMHARRAAVLNERWVRELERN